MFVESPKAHQRRSGSDQIRLGTICRTYLPVWKEGEGINVSEVYFAEFADVALQLET